MKPFSNAPGFAINRFGRLGFGENAVVIHFVCADTLCCNCQQVPATGCSQERRRAGHSILCYLNNSYLRLVQAGSSLIFFIETGLRRKLPAASHFWVGTSLVPSQLQSYD